MRNIPRLGTVKGSTRWHFGEEHNFFIEALCGERFIPMQQGYAYNDWLAEDIEALNACPKCVRVFTFREEEVTELNSMFNLPSERLAPAGPGVSFADWLVESDRQEGHLDTIQFTI